MKEEPLRPLFSDYLRPYSLKANGTEGPQNSYKLGKATRRLVSHFCVAQFFFGDVRFDFDMHEESCRWITGVGGAGE